MNGTPRRTKVLIVDDSAVVRKLLGDALRAEPDIEVVGGAADPFVARDLIVQHNPDVLTLDIEMPRMDGLSFLRRVMAHRPMPVIIISSLTTSGSSASVDAMSLGAIDVIAKPGGPASVGHVTQTLVRRIRALREGPAPKLTARVAAARPAAVAQSGAAYRNAVVVIGASTGGTQAIETVLTRLPADMPPIVIVQHMPPGFTKAFAERLNRTCPMQVVESRGGEPLAPGTVYVAPGDRHLQVVRSGLQIGTRLSEAAPEHYQRPAVDVLFRSAAALKGTPLVAALLTGMGRDGAEGLLALRQAGAETIAEAEHSCIVFGMPKEAIALGAAKHVTSLLDMPSRILASLGQVTSAQRPAGVSH